MSLADQQWCPTSVQVTVLQARGLRIKGKSGTNDAYAVIQVGKDKYQTSVVEKCVAPVWKEEASFDLPQLQQGGGGGGGGSALHVHVLHRALVGPDKLLGQAVINLLQLSEDKTRNKTEWFKLLDKTGKPDKDRGEVLVDIQFMRNNMTASMFDLSAAGKSRSRLSKFKDKVRGKKKDSDPVTSVVPSFTQVLTDSEEEANGDGEAAAGKDAKHKKHKIKSLFSPKSNLQKSMSQSMTVLPGKNSTLSGSQSSGLNVESSEGKKKFKFMIHKRSGSSDSKDSSSGHEKQAPVEQSNLCINGSHIYCEEPPPRTSRISSNFSLTSSGHGSMEDVPENSPSSDPQKAVGQYSPWEEEEEEEEEEEMSEVENLKESVNESKRTIMEEERKEEKVRRQQKKLESLAEDSERQEEEETRRAEEEEVKRAQEKIRREEEKKRQEQKERLRMEEERERLAEEKRLQELERRKLEERRQRDEEERIRIEEEKRLEEERVKMEERRREEQKLAEEKRLQEERRAQEEKRRQEKEAKLAEEKRLQEIERRKLEEERKKQRDEEERIRIEEEEKRLEEERRREEQKLAEEKRRQEKEAKLAEEKRLQEIERRKLEEERKKQRDEEERIRIEEEEKRLEEERRREEQKLAEEKRRLEEEKRAQEEKRRQEEEAQMEEKRLQELERRKLEEERIRIEERKRLEEEKVKMEEARREEQKLAEEKRRLEEERVRKEKENRRKEEERRQKEEEELRKQEHENKRIQLEQERREREEKERIRKEEEKKRQEEERARKEKEEYKRLAEEKMQQEEQRIKEEKIKMEEEERVRMEEEMVRRKEEKERARKEKEEMERLEEERQLKEKEKRRIEEEQKVRREERIRREKKEVEARKLEKLRNTEEHERKESKTKDEGRAAGKKPKVSSPAEITSTNPFDENFSCNPFEEIPESPHSSTATDQQRCQSAVSSVGSKTASLDEKDLISTEREKRPAPQPPGRSQAEKQTHREQDVSARHLAQMNKQSKDKDVKTVSVPPQRSVQMIAPLSRSPTDSKNSQSHSANGTTDAAKHSKRPAPSIPHPVEEKQSSNLGGAETKEAKVVYGLNPFEDDEDENELTGRDDATVSSNAASVRWPPAGSQTGDGDPASQPKIKSLKMAHAPPPPAMDDITSSTLINPATEESCATGDRSAAATDSSALQVCDPHSDATSPVHVQESLLQESQTLKLQNVLEAGVKKDGAQIPSRRLQPVRPLNPLEQQGASVVKGENKNKSTGILSGVQDKTKVTDRGIKGPYSQLTREELISLVLKQENQLLERDHKISELEQYIDNLLVRVIEEKPSILMSMSTMKKAA